MTCVLIVVLGSGLQFEKTCPLQSVKLQTEPAYTFVFAIVWVIYNGFIVVSMVLSSIGSSTGSRVFDVVFA